SLIKSDAMSVTDASIRNLVDQQRAACALEPSCPATLSMHIPDGNTDHASARSKAVARCRRMIGK
ncbi:MAG: hypothetical protein VX298_03145, partial [Pseudomonadota bacterium]|nr:hypothetical protein [Pseudomonadota bacterium]